MTKIIEGERPAIHSDPDTGSEHARELAIKQIERKRAFLRHLAAYTVGSILLVAIWAISEYYNAGGWPTSGFSQSSGIHDVWNIWIIYPILGWGALVAVQGWSTYLRKPISEGEIKREMERQTDQHH